MAVRTVTLNKTYAQADTLHRKRGRLIGIMRVHPDGYQVVWESGSTWSFSLPNGATEMYEQFFERDRDQYGLLIAEDMYVAAWCRLPRTPRLEPGI